MKNLRHHDEDVYLPVWEEVAKARWKYEWTIVSHEWAVRCIHCNKLKSSTRTPYCRKINRNT